MSVPGSLRFFATAAKGTEPALRDELRSMRFWHVRADRGGVHFEGALADGMRACLHSRIAMRVLLERGRFAAKGEQALYDGVRALGWNDHVTPKHTLAVSATCRSSQLTHSQFIALKVKDAIVDEVRDLHGRRPDVDPKTPDVSVVVRLVKDEATVYLDLAGEALHKRGYRVATVEAVMKENLAAAVLRLGGWDATTDLIDPVCGAGTIAIEAAMMACRVAPGLRRRFGFERWPTFDEAASTGWEAMLEAANAEVLTECPVKIIATDIAPEAVDVTTQNLASAGVAGAVTVQRRDARSYAEEDGPAWVVADPPYGGRLAAQPLQLAGFFRQWGESMRAMKGSTVVLISGNPMVERNLGLRPDLEHTLYNGDIECRLLRYRIGE